MQVMPTFASMTERNWKLGHGKLLDEDSKILITHFLSQLLNNRLVDRSGRRLTPGGLALQARPWTERSEGSGSANDLPKAIAWSGNQPFILKFILKMTKGTKSMLSIPFVDNLNGVHLNGLH
jgi:hypothetical protein